MTTPRPSLADPHRSGLPSDDSGERLDAGIAKAADVLLKLQRQDGYWWAELESNCSIHAEYLLMTHFLGVPDPARWQKIVTYLRSKQLSDGGWPVWHGGPGDLSITVEAYFAMKLAGVPLDDPAMTQARTLILKKGGAGNTRVFTKMWLALFGQWDWRGTPSLPPEIMLLPDRSPFAIYAFASWARATIVACAVLLTLKPTCMVPASARIDELYPDGRAKARHSYRRPAPLLSWRSALAGVETITKTLERVPVKPLRKRALARAEQWIVARQEADGSWGGIQPPWVYSLMALKTLGYSLDHPVMRKGIAGFGTFSREDAVTWRMDPCVSPVWDTCLAVLALQDAGLSPAHAALSAASTWLVDKQVLDKGGDWQVKAPGLLPGGWPFEFHNNTYPDIDDTAMVLIALKTQAATSGGKPAARLDAAIERGAAWMAGMQSRNGGWGSFDKDNTRRFVGHIPFCDFGEVLDPPTEDVTAHVVEALARLGYTQAYPTLRRGVEYLKTTQQTDGSWFGRWGVNYVYGLGAVLPALHAAGEAMDQPYIGRAVAWLATHQNEDGGWGEVCESYLDPTLAGKGPSTASQTAWALLALIAAKQSDSDATKRGVQYLLMGQETSGTWQEPTFTGTGFPGAFMLNYHLYRLYWPLMALGRYRQELRGK